jgi:hypothetical protein
MSVRRGFLLAFFVASFSAPSVARTEIEAVASAAATVQPAGPRAGSAGRAFFNIEGKNNGENSVYACFGVVDFKLIKPEAPLGTIKQLTLTLTQSVARFSKAGALKFWVATDTETGLEREGSPLKFDLKVDGGVGTQLKPLLPLGSATFTTRKTGDVDTIAVFPQREAEAFLRQQINRGGVVRLVITPGDDSVAATYFGPGADKTEQRPTLKVDATP